MADDEPTKNEPRIQGDADDAAHEFKSKLVVFGEVTLSPYIKPENSQHIDDVLKAFGPRSPPDIRLIVLAVDWMAIRYWGARTRKLPMKFEDADKLLAQIETHFEKALEAWEQATELYPAIRWSTIDATPLEERRKRELIGPGQPLKDVLLGARALRDPNGYRAAHHQPAGQKSPEREFLWEAFFDLLNQFGLRAGDFSKYQPLTRTIKALHHFIGIDPPDENRFKQARRERIKQEGKTG